MKIFNVEVREDGVVSHRKTVEAYAAILRRIKVFVNLPTLSQLLVTKIYEVAACGACMITPLVKGPGGKNHDYLRDNVRLYDQDRPTDLTVMVKSLLADEAEREKTSRQSCEEMYNDHRIELRLQKILDALK